METGPESTRRTWGVAALLALALTALFAAPAPATTPDPEIRWLPWLGCWAPAISDGMVAVGDAADILCIVPAPSGVELHQVSAGRSVSTMSLLGDGTALPVREAGCEGWRSSEWSADGRRLFLRSELDCDGGTRRVTTGIMAMADGEWVDVHVVEVAGQAASRARRYRPVETPGPLADRLASLEDQRLAVETARQAAAVRLGPDDVAEAVVKAGTAATSVLLVERGDGFRLDRDTLLALHEAGVPGDVIDLMVALSYPEVFEVDPVGVAADFRPEEPWQDDRRRPGYDPVGRTGRIASGLCPGFYDPFGLYGYYGAPLYGSWGISRSRWGSLGACAPLLGWGRYYGPGLVGGPVVIVRSPQPESTARAVRGRGYTRGTRSPEQGEAVRSPRTPRATPTAGASPRPSGGSATSQGTRSSDDRSGGRRARPRGNSGGNNDGADNSR